MNYSNTLSSDTTCLDDTIEQYRFNDNYFRQGIDLDLYRRVPRASLENLTEETYKGLVNHFPLFLSMDIWDIGKYIRVKPQAGLTSLPNHILDIAKITADHVNEEANLLDILWQCFDEDITSVLVAELGMDEMSLGIAHAFDQCMNVIAEIALVIRRYLFNTHAPIVEVSSVYYPDYFQNNILGFRLRTFEEMKDQYRA